MKERVIFSITNRFTGERRGETRKISPLFEIAGLLVLWVAKPGQGVVANTLKLYRNGAIGFIDWLGISIKISNWHAKKGVVQRRSTISAQSYFNTVRGSMNCKSGEPLMKERRSWT